MGQTYWEERKGKTNDIDVLPTWNWFLLSMFSVQTSRIWNDSKLLRLSQLATRWWAPPSSPCLRKEGSLTKTPRSGSPNSVLRLRPPRLARQHLRHKSPVLLFAELNDWSLKFYLLFSSFTKFWYINDWNIEWHTFLNVTQTSTSKLSYPRSMSK